MDVPFTSYVRTSGVDVVVVDKAEVYLNRKERETVGRSPHKILRKKINLLYTQTYLYCLYCAPGMRYNGAPPV